MANQHFTPAKGGVEVKIEYSFVYVQTKEDTLRIILMSPKKAKKQAGEECICLL